MGRDVDNYGSFSLKLEPLWEFCRMQHLRRIHSVTFDVFVCVFPFLQLQWWDLRGWGELVPLRVRAGVRRAGLPHQ